MSDEGPDEEDREIAANVETHGWSCIAVDGNESEPPLAYTIGLCARYGHPEIVLRGLAGDDAHAVLAEAVSVVQKGVRFTLDTPNRGVLEGLTVMFGAVHPTQQMMLMGYAAAYYRQFAPSVTLTAIQLFWPDRNNKLPTALTCSRDVIALQPLLAREVPAEELRAFFATYAP